MSFRAYVESLIDRFLNGKAHPRPVVVAGACYRFVYYPDDGETFQATTDRLVNLTTPDADLLLTEDGRILRHDGSMVGTASDLELVPTLD